MKVFRFMSNDEFQKYRSGKKMISNKDHSKTHNGKTNSKGFCFLNLEEYTPEEAIHFLSGIVSFDICAIFETDTKLNKTYGIYAKPIKSDGDMQEQLIKLLIGLHDSFTANEYCTSEYDKRSFKLLKYSNDIWNQWNSAEMQSDLIWEECNNEVQTTKRNKRKNGKREKTI